MLGDTDPIAAADLPSPQKYQACHATGHFTIAAATFRVPHGGERSMFDYSVICHNPLNHDGPHMGLIVWEGDWEDKE